MNKLTRNLILPAAALAALLLAPASEARDVDRDRGHDREQGRHEESWNGYGRHARFEQEGRWHGRPYRPYWAPAYPMYRHGAPYRVVSGYRFYSVRPGPRYVYVTGYGWVLPPFFGAVWVPGYYDTGGFRIEGYWR